MKQIGTKLNQKHISKTKLNKENIYEDQIEIKTMTCHVTLNCHVSHQRLEMWHFFCKKFKKSKKVKKL